LLAGVAHGGGLRSAASCLFTFRSSVPIRSYVPRRCCPNSMPTVLRRLSDRPNSPNFELGGSNDAGSVRSQIGSMYGHESRHLATARQRLRGEGQADVRSLGKSLLPRTPGGLPPARSSHLRAFFSDRCSFPYPLVPFVADPHCLNGVRCA
jgi:hypothetical protein